MKKGDEKQVKETDIGYQVLGEVLIKNRWRNWRQTGAHFQLQLSELPLCIQGLYNLLSKQRHLSEQDEVLLIICPDGGINLTFLGKRECMTTLPTWFLWHEIQLPWSTPLFSLEDSLRGWLVFLTTQAPTGGSLAFVYFVLLAHSLMWRVWNWPGMLPFKRNSNSLLLLWLLICILDSSSATDVSGP